MGSLPALHIYPGDWYRSPVSGLTLTAQGLWLRLLFLMHDSERRGYLCLNGKPIPPEHIAQRCGLSVELYLALLSELDSAALLGRTSDGILFDSGLVKADKERHLAKERKRKQRGSCLEMSHASVTPMSQPIPSSISSSNNQVTNLIISSSEKRHPPPARNVQPAGDEFFESLKLNPAYEHINLVAERGKMEAWLSLPKNKARKLTRQFVLNWLNRIEKPLEVRSGSDFSQRAEGLKSFVEKNSGGGFCEGDVPDIGFFPENGIPRRESASDVRSPKRFDA